MKTNLLSISKATKLITLFAVIFSLSIGAMAQLTKFPMDTYVAVTKPGINSAAKNYTIYTSSSPMSGYNPVVTMSLTHDLNGTGLNPIDSFLYGAAYVGADNTVNNNFGVAMYRVGQNGQYEDLGLLPFTGENGVELVNFSAGAISQDGYYYYTTIGIKTSGVNKMLLSNALGTPLNIDTSDIKLYVCWIKDINTLSANSGNNIPRTCNYYQVDFSNPDVAMAISNFLNEVNANYPNIYNSDGGIQDIAINPSDTKIYAYITYPDGAAVKGRPVVISGPLVNGLLPVTPVGSTVNTTPGHEITGVAFDNNNNFYGLFTTGQWAAIDLTSGAITLSPSTNIDISNNNLRGDLASPFTNIALPVKWLTFNVNAIKNGVQLNWSTAMETNNKGYEVQYSNDGKTWNTIGFVNTKSIEGFSNIKLSYTFIAPSPKSSNNYYRLKQININGQFTYSSVQTLYINIDNNLKVYPNPTSNTITISGININDKIEIYNVYGRKMISKISKGTTSTIKINHLSSGNYFIKLTSTSGQVNIEKFIIDK